MSQKITLAQLKRWLYAYIDRIIEQEAYLTELDAAIGDGDHGSNMVRGWSKVRAWLEAEGESCADVSTLLRTVAMTLISNVGGAAGPLYGAFFLRAAKDAAGGEAVDLPQLAQMFRSGLEGVQQRGKAQLEEKTMIDAMQPAVAALDAAAQAGASIEDALAAAQRSAEAGMVHTIDIEATKGRASYLGPRSIGHQDPGATSTYFLFETALTTLVAR
jgi:dihydroxyacetone kinase-like protein